MTRGGGHMLSEKSQRTQNGTVFVDLDRPLNASRRLSASAELLVSFTVRRYVSAVLTVCLSVRYIRVLSPNGYGFKDTVKRFSTPGSPIILVFFPAQMALRSKGTSSAWR